MNNFIRKMETNLLDPWLKALRKVLGSLPSQQVRSTKATLIEIHVMGKEFAHFPMDHAMLEVTSMKILMPTL